MNKNWNNPDAVKQKNKLLDFFKKYKIRTQVEGVKKIQGADIVPAIDRATNTLPNIEANLEAVGLSSKSGTIASKAWDLTKKVGKYGIARPIAGITLPGTQIIPETVKAVKEERLPDYDLTNPNTWMHAAFWNWAVKEWGFDKTVKNFGESLKNLSTGDKARVFRNVVARAGLSPKAIQFISSRVAWPLTGIMSVHDAYEDYQERKEFLTPERIAEAQKEEFDKEEPMFAMGGIASLIK